MKTFFSYISFMFNYGLLLSVKIIIYEIKYINYYKDSSPNYISNDKLEIKNYDISKVTGYSPAYYYYLKLIKSYFKKKKIKFNNVYDIGFGTGRVIYFFRYLAKNIYGFEISKKLFDIGEKKLKKEIQKDKNLKLYFKDALKFNEFKNNSLIFVFDAFTKFEDLEVLIENLSKLKNSYLVYANPRFRKKVKSRFKEVFLEKNQNFRGLSIFKI
ncbi:class I SAM-dependent methyltransferase [Candidatus Pelagibacter sp.]|jgi:SAM-dependent methyltransferase|nr:class I SAM-dependent methyltransferase [Candidatus Pelagibacter sp.]